MESTAVQDEIDAIWSAPSDDASGRGSDLIESVIAGIDDGTYRCAEKRDGVWTVCLWVKKALAVYFRRQESQTQAVGPFTIRDKFPLKQNAEAGGYRVAPLAGARYGSYIAPGATLMPSFVNLGSWIGSGTLIDTWVSVGTCAQIGDRVTILPCSSVIGSIHPVTALPAIIEDDCYVGSACVVGAGVRVGSGAVIGHGTVVAQGVPIVDIASSDRRRYVDEIPPSSIVTTVSHRGDHERDATPTAAAIVGYREPGERAAEALARALGQMVR